MLTLILNTLRYILTLVRRSRNTVTLRLPDFGKNVFIA